MPDAFNASFPKESKRICYLSNYKKIRDHQCGYALIIKRIFYQINVEFYKFNFDPALIASTSCRKNQ
jgi:hypothetical protein